MKHYILALALSASAISAGAQPVITNQPASQIVKVGGTAVFSVSVSGSGPFTYQWLFNSNSITTNGIITTVAGGGAGGGTDGLGGGGAATNATLNSPGGTAVDAAGNLFIADSGNNRIRKVSTNGIITTVAGGGMGGLGDGGVATNATISGPACVSLDGSGNLLIADYGNNRIRKVDTNGIIRTIVGGGAGGGTDGLGDGGAATNATLNNPVCVIADSAGNLLIADAHNNRVRKVSTNGIITSIAGGGAGGGTDGLGDGGPATNATFNYLNWVAVDAVGNLFINDGQNFLIRKVDTNGIITKVAGGGTGGGTDGIGDGGAATNAILSNPNCIIFDPAGNLLIADWGHNRVRKVDASGIITAIVGGGTGGLGDGGAATDATVNGPLGLSFDSSGDLFLADYFNNRIRKVSANYNAAPILTLKHVTITNAGYYQVIVTSPYGSVTSSIVTLTVPYLQITQQPTNQVATNGGTATFNVAVSGTGPFTYQWFFNSNNITTNAIITTVAGNGSAGFSGDGGAATNASLNNPFGTTVDASGNLFIADYGNNRIRGVTSNGIIFTIAGNGSAGYSGDNGPADNASLNAPTAVSLDSSGNVFIADYHNNRIRKLSTNGIITTVAGNGAAGFSGDGDAATNASLRFPSSVALGPDGNLFIADSGNNRIREVNTNGIITTVAGNGSASYSGDGGAATNASFNDPTFLTVDGSGSLFIADYYNNRVRKVSTNGVITTVAGNGGAGYSGDGGAATNASVNLPICVAVDASGNLFVAGGSQRIRKITTTGIITTVAGNGSAGYSGDGGTATNASLSNPSCVAVDLSGNLFIADSLNNRVRKIGNFNASPTLTLNNVTTNNAGNYQVIVSSSYGSVTSSVATLAVPLTVLPGSVEVTILPSAAVSAGAKWELDNGPLQNSGDVVSNVTSGTHTITFSPVAGWFMPGSQIVTVVSGQLTNVGATYNTITEQPTDQVVTAGGPATFSVAVSGTGPFTYHWLFNGNRITTNNGIITTIAGNGVQGYSGDGGAATNASLNLADGMAFDASGNLFIADTWNNRIRKISVDGIITTLGGGRKRRWTGHFRRRRRGHQCQYGWAHRCSLRRLWQRSYRR